MKLHEGATIAGGKYTLIRLLGKGAQGQVWEAWQRSLEGFTKLVVLKFQILSSPENEREREQQEELHRMFLNEARLAAKLHHPNIVEIYDLGREGSLDYIAMERIQGRDLGDLLFYHQEKYKKPIPWSLAVQMMMQICKGLHAAHIQADERGNPLDLIHRDLKPANILLTYEGSIKIIDFGIAKATSNLGATATGMVKGTPYYMSPEQLKDPKSMDARADLFALGGILYELCCGKKPFYKENLHSLMFAIMSESPMPVTERADDLPQALDSFLQRALEKDPNARFRSASDMRHALKQLCQEQGIFPDQDDLAELYLSLFPRPKPSPTPPVLSRTAPFGEGATAAGSVPTTGDIEPNASDPPRKTPTMPSFPAGEAIPNAPRAEARSNEASGHPKRLALGMSATLLFAALAGGYLLFTSLPANNRDGGGDRRVGGELGSLTTRALRDASANKPAARLSEPRPARSFRRRVRPPKMRSVLPMVRRKSLLKRIPPPRASRACRRLGFGWVKIRVFPRCKLYKGAESLGFADGQKAHKISSRRAQTIECFNPKQKVRVQLKFKAKACRTTTQTRRLRKGKFWVWTRPWSKIRIVGFGWDWKSLRYHSLFEGKYRLVLFKKGNMSHRKEATFVIKAGRTTECRYKWGASRISCNDSP